jgi:hypothetical protein
MLSEAKAPALMAWPPGIAVAWFKQVVLGRTVWMGDGDLPHTI